jgi:RimJ/RimL family protein N-acetyltransferase
MSDPRRIAPERRPAVPELRTERLVLRAWRDADRAPFAELNADPAVMEHFPSVLDRDASDAMVDRVVERWAAGRPSLWAVEVPGEAAFIGFVGLLEPSFTAPFTPCIEVGWRLAAPFWGRGYAPEAAAAALGHGFGTYGPDEIVSFTVPANTNSRRVMEKLGMRHDPADDFDHPNLPAGDPLRRHVLYRLPAAEWRGLGGGSAPSTAAVTGK